MSFPEKNNGEPSLTAVAHAFNAAALLKGEGLLSYDGSPITFSSANWRAFVGL